MANDTELTLLEIMRRFSTEEAARAYFERLRWPNGPVCPHCGNAEAERIYALTPNAAARIREGLFKCGECRDDFSVTVGTVMESSHIPLHKWLIAFYMMCASKTQVSALQLKRQLEIGSYRSALFLCHRIRFALKDVVHSDKLDGEVEADETYVGGKARGKSRAYKGNKAAVVSLVERNGRVRSTVVANVNQRFVSALLSKNVEKTAHLNTDESPLYKKSGKGFASHKAVNHSHDEYARFDEETGRNVTTNTVEGYFGNSKRSIDGTHHQVSRKHLHLYVAELDFKYNTRKSSDGRRTVEGIQKMEGKRLMLHRPKGAV